MEENQNQEQHEEQNQEQVETVAKEDYDNLVNELEQVKGKLPKEPTEEELAFQKREADLFNREVNATLKENGLEQFASVVKVSNNDELEETVKALTQIKNDIMVSTGYVPEDHAKDDEYSNYEKNNDVAGMIGTKLGKLFK
ncbi:hypothetical protein ACQ4XT_11415 [Halobacillus faecis]